MTDLELREAVAVRVMGCQKHSWPFLPGTSAGFPQCVHCRETLYYHEPEKQAGWCYGFNPPAYDPLRALRLRIDCWAVRRDRRADDFIIPARDRDVGTNLHLCLRRRQQGFRWKADRRVLPARDARRKPVESGKVLEEGATK